MSLDVIFGMTQTLNDLSRNIGALVGHAGHAVGDDGLALWDSEEELVVHPDVRAQHDAVGDLKCFQ